MSDKPITHTDQEWDDLPGKLKRIVLESCSGEWVDKNTYIAVIYDFPYTDRYNWQVWQSYERGWAKKIADDKSTAWRNANDAIAAARRQLELMETIP